VTSLPDAGPPIAPGETARDRLLAVVLVAIPVILLACIIFVLKHDTPIWGDGARVINERLPPTLRTLLRPFHQHLNAVPIALWAILPTSAAKLAALLVSHVVLSTATTAVLVARVGRTVGVALGLPLGLLGTAHFDLLMPWQILFSLALIFGLVATMASLPRHRTWTLRILVAGSVAIATGTSNIGLFVGLALGLWFVIERRWTQLLELAPTAVLWVMWFLIVGRHGLKREGLDLTLAVVPYTIAVVSNGVGAVAGVGWFGGLLIIGAVIAYVVVRRGITVPPPLIAFPVALFLMYAALRVVRGEVLGNGLQARYIYMTGFLLAFGLAAGAPRLPQTRWWLITSLYATLANLGVLARVFPTYP
jgi:hypothetical protein